MSKERKSRDKFPHVAGLSKKRTKFGHRWILTERDTVGENHSVTVKILDNDPIDVFYRKINEARSELRRRHRNKTIESYLNEYAVIKQLTPNTIKLYRRVLNGFSFDEKNNKKRVHEILSKDNKISTIKVYIGKIDTFYNWLIRRGETVRNPVIDICIKPNVQPRRRIMTDDELNCLKSYAMNRSNSSYTLFILLLIETGARASTIGALTLDDLDDQGYLHLYNVKSKKDYDYPFKVTNNTIKELWHEKLKDGVLWDRDPEKYRGKLEQWMHTKFKKDSNGEFLSPHSIRHTFATNAVRNGVPIEIVSKLLDHASPSTTLRVYARFSQEQIDDGMRRATAQKSSCVGGIQTHEPESTMKTNTQTHKKAVSSEQN